MMCFAGVLLPEISGVENHSAKRSNAETTSPKLFFPALTDITPAGDA